MKARLSEIKNAPFQLFALRKQFDDFGKIIVILQSKSQKGQKKVSGLPQRTCRPPCNELSMTCLLQLGARLASPESPGPPEAAEWQC